MLTAHLLKLLHYNLVRWSVIWLSCVDHYTQILLTIQSSYTVLVPWAIVTNCLCFIIISNYKMLPNFRSCLSFWIVFYIRCWIKWCDIRHFLGRRVSELTHSNIKSFSNVRRIFQIKSNLYIKTFDRIRSSPTFDVYLICGALVLRAGMSRTNFVRRSTTNNPNPKTITRNR